MEIKGYILSQGTLFRYSAKKRLSGRCGAENSCLLLPAIEVQFLCLCAGSLESVPSPFLWVGDKYWGISLHQNHSYFGRSRASGQGKEVCFSVNDNEGSSAMKLFWNFLTSWGDHSPQEELCSSWKNGNVTARTSYSRYFAIHQSDGRVRLATELPSLIASCSTRELLITISAMCSVTNTKISTRHDRQLSLPTRHNHNDTNLSCPLPGNSGGRLLSDLPSTSHTNFSSPCQDAYSVILWRNYRNRSATGPFVCDLFTLRSVGRDSDPERARRSADRIPVGAKFSASAQTGPVAHPASCSMGAVSLPWEKNWRGVALTTYAIYHRI